MHTHTTLHLYNTFIHTYATLHLYNTFILAYATLNYTLRCAAHDARARHTARTAPMHFPAYFTS